MADPTGWSAALDAQLDLIRWWRSDQGLIQGVYLATGETLGGPEAEDAADYAAAALKARRVSASLVERHPGGKVVVRINHRTLLADWPKYEARVQAGFTLAYDYAETLDRSATYWVSREMGRFLFHAHQDIPPHGLAVTDLPASRGFVYFAEPLLFEDQDSGDPLSMRALKWDLYDKTQPTTVDIQAFRETKVGLYPGRLAMWPEGQPPKSSLAKLLQAFWILSGQRIARAESRPVERHTRKRGEKAGFVVPEDGIRVVTLRRPETTATQGAQYLVDWSHRWIVSGHWRDQWYPSDETHRPKWIEAYEKGPDDKPLVLKDRVYRWVR